MHWGPVGQSYDGEIRSSNISLYTIISMEFDIKRTAGYTMSIERGVLNIYPNAERGGNMKEVVFDEGCSSRTFIFHFGLQKKKCFNSASLYNIKKLLNNSSACMQNNAQVSDTNCHLSSIQLCKPVIPELFPFDLVL